MGMGAGSSLGVAPCLMRCKGPETEGSAWSGHPGLSFTLTSMGSNGPQTAFVCSLFPPSLPPFFPSFLPWFLSFNFKEITIIRVYWTTFLHGISWQGWTVLVAFRWGMSAADAHSLLHSGRSLSTRLCSFIGFKPGLNSLSETSCALRVKQQRSNRQLSVTCTDSCDDLGPFPKPSALDTTLG